MPATRGVKRSAPKVDPEADATVGPSKLRKKHLPIFKVICNVEINKKLGEVLATGQGDVGQLGLGEDFVEKLRFTLVKALGSIITDICAGGMHTVCIDKNGDVWTFGCNDEGALGRDTTEGNINEWTPGKVKLPGKVIKVSAGDSHTAALLENGQVYAWGSFRDSHGNMGLTVKGNERTPIEMLPDQKIVQIASGGDHLVMLTELGQVFTCGCAEQGQLGRITARSCDRHSRLGLNPLLLPAPLQFRPRDKLNFDMIWSGTHCTFAREASKGDIYAWGLNNYEQIGVRKGKQSMVYAPMLSEAFTAIKDVKWVKIAGGQHHILALDAQGTCYALGRREYGRLGLGEGCEDAVDLTPVPVLQGKKCTHIACGTAASFAVTDTGDVYAWGMGSSGQLGTGSENDETEPKHLKSGQLTGRFVLNVSAGGQHTVILVASSKDVTDDIKEPESADVTPQNKVETDETPNTEEMQVDLPVKEVKVDAELVNDDENEIKLNKIDKPLEEEKMDVDPPADEESHKNNNKIKKLPNKRGRKPSTSSSKKSGKNNRNGRLKSTQNNQNTAETITEELETDNAEKDTNKNQNLKRSKEEKVEVNTKHLKVDANIVNDQLKTVDNIDDKSIINPSTTENDVLIEKKLSNGSEESTKEEVVKQS